MSQQLRRRYKHLRSLEERLAEEVKRLREEAQSLRAGMQREAILRKAGKQKTGSHIRDIAQAQIVETTYGPDGAGSSLAKLGPPAV